MALMKLAVRNLRRNRRRTAITIAALVFGVGAAVAMRGFINGMQRMMMENIVYGNIGSLQVHRAGYQANVLTSPLLLDMPDSEEVRRKILAVPHVKAVAARIEFGGMLSTPDKKPPPEDGSPLAPEDQGRSSFFFVTAIEPENEKQVTPRRFATLDQGEMFATADAPYLVLNAEFAKGMGLSVQPRGAPLPKEDQMDALLAPDRDGALNGENVVVGGTFPSYAPGDKRIGFAPLKLVQRLLRMEGRVTSYAVQVEPLEAVEQARDGIRAALGPDYEALAWSEIFPFLKAMIGTQDFLFSIVSGVVLSVVLLGIVNAMLMTVLERTREIGTMLAVGMRRRQVVFLFVLEGLVQGVLGGALGLLLGWLVVQFLHSHGIQMPAPGASVPSTLRPVVYPPLMVGVVLGTPLGAAFASLWPAWRASRLRPVEALQSV